MDVQTAIDQYKKLSPKIFHQGFERYFGANILRSIFGISWFKGRALEDGIKDILKKSLPEDEKSRLGTNVTEATLVPASGSLAEVKDYPKSCRTYELHTCSTMSIVLTIELFRFVCAFDTRDESAVRLRAYRSSSATHKMCKIWEAARATSAAPFYFPPVTISGKEYWDGGLAYNNPAHEVWAEAESLFGAKLVNCFISLGTGFSERKPKRSLFPVLGKGKKILQSVTNTQRMHTLLEERTRNRGIPYFRFNASTARDKIGLADYQLLDTLEKHTVTYLKDEDTQTYIKQCAELLAHRSLRPPAPNIEPVVADAPGLAHY
jgi:predicted acylesterase/phospholipase RssA